MNPQWRRDAACAGEDPGVFFPERGDVRAVDAAKAICAGCPVVGDCREAHLGERDGIWFGTSPGERKRLRALRPGRPVRFRKPIQAERRTPRPGQSMAPHGSRTRYVAGCLCVDCYEAESAYQAARHLRRRASDLASQVQAG